MRVAADVFEHALTLELSVLHASLLNLLLPTSQRGAWHRVQAKLRVLSLGMRVATSDCEHTVTLTLVYT